LFIAVCTVALIALSLGCRGFFVKPTLNSINVTPTKPNLQVGQTQQLTATGVNNDGSQDNLTTRVSWTSATPSQVSVSSTGLVKALANTSTSGVQITATSGTVEGSATVTVGQASSTVTVTSQLGNSISLTSNGGAGTTVNFTASEGGSDVTSSASWSSSNQSVITTPSAGVASLGGSTGTVTITATTSNGSGSVQVTVQP
jgi:uncharacterized protein YjdB